MLYFGSIYQQKRIRDIIAIAQWNKFQIINESDSFNTDLEKPVVDISSLNPSFAQMIIDFHTKLMNRSIDNPRTSEGAQLDSLINN